MRMILHAKLPHYTFNAAVKDGTAGAKIKRILDQQKPEAAYFTEYGGTRGAILVVDVTEASRIPSFAEPWFLLFNADVEFHPAMTPQDLARAGLEELGREWSDAEPPPPSKAPGLSSNRPTFDKGTS
jgi:hypothetical protein